MYRTTTIRVGDKVLVTVHSEAGMDSFFLPPEAIDSVVEELRDYKARSGVACHLAQHAKLSGGVA